MKKYIIAFFICNVLSLVACGNKEMVAPSEEENALYEQFIEGNVADANGDNCCYAKNDPYYDEYIDLEWALFDLNGDGINELIPRLYGSYTAELYTCSDGKIKTSSNELFGSEGGFINTKNQLVATDCTHANRNQYLISEFTGDEVNIVLFFAKWWEDEDNQDDAEYVKYEGDDYWDVSYDDFTVITKDEYEKLLQEYTQKNDEVIFTKR